MVLAMSQDLEPPDSTATFTADQWVDRLMAGRPLLTENPHNVMEVVEILAAYGRVLGDYSTNLLYIANHQFLELFPIFKYMNGDRSPSKLLRHSLHQRINYEFAEYCMKAMLWHGGGGMDTYLDSPEFVAGARRAIEAKISGNPMMRVVDRVFSEFLLEQVRMSCYYSNLGQFWTIMNRLFMDLEQAYRAKEVTTILDVVTFVKNGLVADAATPITYSVEIKGQTYDILPASQGLTFLVDAAIPYVEAVFFRSLPFMGTLSYNAQARMVPQEQARFTYGALFADPLPAGGGGIPPTLLTQDMLNYLGEDLLAYYRTFGRGEHDLRVKMVVSFQKSMFCVTNGAIFGLAPADPVAARAHYQAWVDRLLTGRLMAVQD
jgi:CO2 hydration protein